jgi:hypothetical protein
VLIIVASGVTLLRTSTIGRTLRALRGSEVASQSIGISSGQARTIAFAVSAAIAALGGSMVAIHQKAVNYDLNFSPTGSLFWLVLVVTFGARETSGAVTAAGAYSLIDRLFLQGTIFGWLFRDPDRVPGFFPISAKWRFIMFGLGTIQYAKHPENAKKFLEYLASPSAQAYFANGNNEWPVVKNVPLNNPALQTMGGANFKSDPLPVSFIGMNQIKVQQMLDHVGFR